MNVLPLVLVMFVVAVYSAPHSYKKLDSNEIEIVVVDEKLDRFIQTVKDNGNMNPFYEEFKQIVLGLKTRNEKFEEDLEKSHAIFVLLMEKHTQDEDFEDINGWESLAATFDSMAKSSLKRDLTEAITWIEHRLPVVKQDREKYYLKNELDYLSNLDLKVQVLVSSAVILRDSIRVINSLVEIESVQVDHETEAANVKKAEEANSAIDVYFQQLIDVDYDGKDFLSKVEVLANDILK